MKCSDIIKILEQRAPLSMACDWDNPGLLTGKRDKEIKTILLALDATEAVIEQALEAGADMILTHHPLIFKPVKKINDDDFTGRRLLKLIGNDICCYAMHTNFDAAPGCMGDLAANLLGLKEQSVLEVMGTAAVFEGSEEVEEYGIGKCGLLSQEVTLTQLAGRVKQVFGLPFVTVFGDGERKVKQAAICPGAGGSTMGAALRSGADVYITGDISHHEGIDAVAGGMAVIDAGHYGIEHIFMDFMEGFLSGMLDGNITVIKAADAFPNFVL